jgi:hypothetical protein
MNIQTARTAVEQIIKLPINMPVAMVIMLVTAPMATTKAPVTTVPASKSAPSGNISMRPIMLPPFLSVPGKTYLALFEESHTRLPDYAHSIFPHLIASQAASVIAKPGENSNGSIYSVTLNFVSR